MCICLSLHLCIIIIYLSISLEVSVSVFVFVLFSFNFSFGSSFFFEPLNFPYCSLSPGFFFQLPLLFPLGEIYTIWYTDLYLTSSVTTANSVTSFISNCSIVKKHESLFYLLPWGSMRRITRDGNIIANVCHCWDFLFIRYLISITSLIPKIFYLVDLYCYIPPLYWGEDWDTHGHMACPRLQNITCNQSYVFTMVCIKFW